LVSQVNENVFESLDVFFGNIENCALLVLVHAHASDVVDDVLCEEFPQDAPHERDRLESLLEFELYCDEIFLSGEQRSRVQL